MKNPERSSELEAASLKISAAEGERWEQQGGGEGVSGEEGGPNMWCQLFQAEQRNVTRQKPPCYMLVLMGTEGPTLYWCTQTRLLLFLASNCQRGFTLAAFLFLSVAPFPIQPWYCSCYCILCWNRSGTEVWQAVCFVLFFYLISPFFCQHDTLVIWDFPERLCHHIISSLLTQQCCRSAS